jgi:hypothetical protein
MGGREGVEEERDRREGRKRRGREINSQLRLYLELQLASSPIYV